MENLNMPTLQFSPKTDTNPDGYPLYAVSEDIYQQPKAEADINPEDITSLKDLNEPKKQNEKKMEGDASNSERYIPGSELDNADEMTGSEDEENNNHYSLGGHTLNNPEEDHGE